MLVVTQPRWDQPFAKIARDQARHAKPKPPFLRPVIRVTHTVGVAVGVVVVLTLWLLRRPLPHLGVLLVVALPLMFLGQLWAILTIGPQRKGTRFRWGQGLSPRTARGLGTVVGFCFLTGMISFLLLRDGGPATATAACRYPLSNHGAVTCVNEARYRGAGAAEQRLLAAWMTLFLGAQLSVALADAPKDPPGGQPSR